MWKVVVLGLLINLISVYADSCRGDTNATRGCDLKCKRRCIPLNKMSICKCPEKKSCKCKDDYVFDMYSFKCVLPNDCSNKPGDKKQNISSTDTTVASTTVSYDTTQFITSNCENYQDDIDYKCDYDSAIKSSSETTKLPYTTTSLADICEYNADVADYNCDYLTTKESPLETKTTNHNMKTTLPYETTLFLSSNCDNYSDDINYKCDYISTTDSSLETTLTPYTTASMVATCNSNGDNTNNECDQTSTTELISERTTLYNKTTKSMTTYCDNYGDDADYECDNTAITAMPLDTTTESYDTKIYEPNNCDSYEDETNYECQYMTTTELSTDSTQPTYRCNNNGDDIEYACDNITTTELTLETTTSLYNSTGNCDYNANDIDFECGNKKTTKLPISTTTVSYDTTTYIANICDVYDDDTIYKCDYTTTTEISSEITTPLLDTSTSMTVDCDDNIYDTDFKCDNTITTEFTLETTTSLYDATTAMNVDCDNNFDDTEFKCDNTITTEFTSETTTLLYNTTTAMTENCDSNGDYTDYICENTTKTELPLDTTTLPYDTTTYFTSNCDYGDEDTYCECEYTATELPQKLSEEAISCQNNTPNKMSTTTTTTTELATTITEEITECPDAEAQILRAMLSYSVKFLNVIAKTNKDMTVVGSAVSLMCLMGGLKLHAYGETDRELSELLNVSDNRQVRCGLIKLFEYVSQLPSDVDFYFGNNLAVNTQYPLSKTTMQDWENVVGGKAYNVNFTQSEQATKIIDNQIQNQTNNLVTDVIESPNLVNKTTQLGLFSGLYYSSQFLYKPKLTEGRNFSVTPCKTVKLPYYYFCEKFNYTESLALKAKILEIPLTGIQRLVVIIPKIKFGHNAVLKKLQNPYILLTERNKLTPHEVAVYLPTINASMTNDVKDILIKTNAAPSIMNNSTAQLCNLFVGDHHVELSLGIQKINFVSQLDGKLEPSKICEQQPRKRIIMDLNYPFIWILFVKDIPSYIGLYANNNFAQL